MMKDKKWYIDFLCLQYKYYNPNYDAVAETFQLARQHLVSSQDAYFAVQELLYRFYRKKSERQFEQRRREMATSYVLDAGQGMITHNSKSCRKTPSGK